MMKNRVIEIRKKINATLKTVTNNVHFQSAADDSSLPYLVFDLPNSIDDGSLEQFVLDVDGWDNKADTNDLETLMHNVDTALHRKTFVIDNLTFTLYRDNRLSLTDKEANLRRRKYIYQIRVLEGR